jgi:tetratricopeptide (TPR) repeat protein
LGDVQGKAATYLKAAHAAMAKGDYQKALDQAQAALREEPGDAQAQKIASAATDGQKAAGHFRLAEEALRAQQFADAQTQAETGRGLAPWDKRGPDLLTRIHEAERRAQQEAENQKRAQAAAQVAGLLGQAANELAAGRFDAAVGLYDEVLKLDPANGTAMTGKTSAVAAKAIAQAQTGPKAAGKGFVPGKTVAQSLESQAGRVPAGFDDGGINVKRTVSAELPGKINIEVRPQSVLPGEKYTLRVEFANEGDASIPLKEMTITMVVDGKKAGGPVPLGVKEVAPHQKETLFNQTDFWKEIGSWSVEVLVRTVRGDVYKNQVTWK